MFRERHLLVLGWMAVGLGSGVGCAAEPPFEPAAGVWWPTTSSVTTDECGLAEAGFVLRTFELSPTDAGWAADYNSLVTLDCSIRRQALACDPGPFTELAYTYVVDLDGSFEDVDRFSGELAMDRSCDDPLCGEGGPCCPEADRPCSFLVEFDAETDA